MCSAPVQRPCSRDSGAGDGARACGNHCDPPHHHTLHGFLHSQNQFCWTQVKVSAGPCSLWRLWGASFLLCPLLGAPALLARGSMVTWPVLHLCHIPPLPPSSKDTVMAFSAHRITEAAHLVSKSPLCHPDPLPPLPADTELTEKQGRKCWSVPWRQGPVLCTWDLSDDGQGTRERCVRLVCLYEGLAKKPGLSRPHGQRSTSPQVPGAGEALSSCASVSHPVIRES